jgi:hypothetical protein
MENATHNSESTTCNSFSEALRSAALAGESTTSASRDFSSNADAYKQDTSGT